MPKARIKTKGLENPLRVAAVGNMRQLRKVNEYLYEVELWLLNDLVNRNNWKFINLEDHRSLFAGTPVLIAYIGDGTGIGDGHNFEMKRDPKSGEWRPSFTAATAERIVGSISDDPNDIRIEMVDGVPWIVARATLWKWYAPELVDKIATDAQIGRSMSVSIEALIDKFHFEEDVEVEERWTPLGTTILGDHVMPAVKDARIEARDKGRSFAELKMKAASYQGTQKPQKNLNDKGGRKPMAGNKKAMARLAPKFEGYKIIGLSEDGMTVALLNQAGETYSYTFGPDDQGEVILAKLQAANVVASVVTNSEEGGGMEVDVDEMIDYVTNGVRDQAKTIENLNAQLEQANATIEAMKQAEEKRRTESVKETLERTMKEIEASAEEGEDLAALKKQAEELAEKAPEYAKLEAADGTFIGDKQARKDLLALNGERSMKEAAARKKAAQKPTYTWGTFNEEAGQDEGSVGALLSRLGIE